MDNFYLRRYSSNAREDFRPRWVESDILYFDDSVPVYSKELGRVRNTCITKGQQFDVISLLSWAPRGMPTRNFLITRDGDKVDIVKTLQGQYVVVCCVFLPLRYSSNKGEARIFQAIAVAASQPDCPFKVVIVPKLRPQFDSKHDFDSFFHAFPSSCLAIPYQESLSRDYVCRTLCLHKRFGPLAALIVDPNGKVLQTLCSFFPRFGIHAFPFTDMHIDSLSLNAEVLKCRVDNIHFRMKIMEGRSLPKRHPITLEELLSFHPIYPLPLPPTTAPHRYLPPRHLESRYVGLYLCYHGKFINSLCQLHQQCKDRGLQFDILFVQLDFLVPSSYFVKSVCDCLSKYNTSSSCWLFPYSETNDYVCRRLWTLTNNSLQDQLIVLPPASKIFSGDLLGKCLIKQYGVDAYPFTRDSILHRSLLRLKKLTLKNLFPSPKPLVRAHDLLVVNVSQLRGKQVLIYIDAECHSVNKFFSMFSSYHEIRRQYPDFVLIYVPQKGESPEKLREIDRFIEMQCLFSCSSAMASIFFDKKEYIAANTTLVAVGKNGRILSRRAQLYLDEMDGSLFADNLSNEIVSDLSQLVDLFDY